MKGWRQLSLFSGGATSIHASGWGSKRAEILVLLCLSRSIFVDWVVGGKQVPAALYFQR